jgi:hypothetical protein
VEVKKDCLRAQGAGKGVYTGAERKVYSCFPARAGSFKLISFFFRLIGY